MQFKDVIGQEEVKSRLRKGIEDGRIAHTQLFLGPEGSGALPMAIAYGQYINCNNRTETDSCGTCPSCIKFEKYSHPDLHFYFPNTTTDSVKKEPESKLFLPEWRKYLSKCDSYATKSAWHSALGVGNKQGLINVRDAKDVVGKMSMKPYEANFKVIILWLAERMNMEASNKLLKTFEEPPSNTLILLVAERYELIIPTVRSRAQLVKFNKISDTDIEIALRKLKPEVENEQNLSGIAKIAKGNWNEALTQFTNIESVNDNFLRFRQWLRLCFVPKTHTELFAFNQELARIGRERQKSFLNYGLLVVHNSIMANSKQLYAIKSVGEELDFTKSFAPYINSANRQDIYELLNHAIYHIERNAHAGIIFTDLSLKLVRLLRKGKAEVKK